MRKLWWDVRWASGCDEVRGCRIMVGEKQSEVCWLWWCGGGGEVGTVVLQAEVWWREVTRLASSGIVRDSEATLLSCRSSPRAHIFLQSPHDSRVSCSVPSWLNRGYNV